MGFIGLILIILGIICVLLGIVGGTRLMFRKQNDGSLYGALPTAVFDVIKALVEAPTYKMFFGGGLLLIVLGAVLNGLSLSSS